MISRMWYRIQMFFKHLFKSKDPIKESIRTPSKEETEKFIRAQIQHEEAERQKKLETAYRQYRRYMIKHSQTPATFNGWIKGKHPLHSSHFGTFSPVRPIRRRGIQ